MKQQGNSNSKRVPGRPFPKGRSGNPSGRPKGAKNKVSRDLKEVLAQGVRDPDYQERLLQRLKAGKLHPTLERTAWEHEIGKVADRTVVDVGPTLADILRAAAGQPLGVGAPQASPLQSGDSTDGGGDQEQAQPLAIVSSKIVDGGKGS